MVGYIVVVYLLIGVIVLIWKRKGIPAQVTETQIEQATGRKRAYVVFILATVLMWWAVLIGAAQGKRGKKSG